MSQTSDNLMKQLYFIMRAGRYYMFKGEQPISGQKRVLAVLKLEDGLTQNYLAEILALKPGSLAELLKKMEVKGYIERNTDENDKRVKRVYLTALGKKEAEKLEKISQEYDTSSFFSGLSEEEQIEVSRKLEKIANGWDDDFKHQAPKFVDPTFRMKAFRQWRSAAVHHEFSKEEIETIRHRMSERNSNGFHCQFNHHGFKDRYCSGERMNQYDKDFWKKFWGKDDKES
ncbi:MULTISPECIES: MarR family winged helix-turn-helix transcriptional regulator [unclassified Lactobacillus]|uniref:MarR family winged helix-turn-helix transcriptional regulator n=1 Tax=unclassified Lactobacillus TaxID=2620435 RepID=UPI000EFA4E16|nr:MULTISPECIES: MarR family winged helix-turn-helix transcriptional regulator [unclassified Lactobacillus]RMC24885.1 MarR family transcriptional regulator [Lactobacillus sp. ESL0247]RMC29039.1 MarR family transcriptional regulator [Lactobacillus sp. ESL0246]RMC32642.1 MarR family transcriptional regulator [Lactobacillus sp. ESL0245]